MHEFYNVSTFTPAKMKRIQNMAIWGYYIMRNYLEYGTSVIDLMYLLGKFPIDLLKDIFTLLWFQEQSGAIYDSYINNIKLQNKVVSFISLTVILAL